MAVRKGILPAITPYGKWQAILLAFAVGITGWLLFLLFQAQGIWAGDSGDLVTAAAVMGVAHPPGYPLFTLLGFLLSKLPIATVSWRVTLLSSLPHAITLGGVFLSTYIISGYILELKKKNYNNIRLTGSLFAAASLGGNYLFFLYSTTPEVFALLDLFVITAFVLGLLWYQSEDSRLIYLGSFLFGLSLTHHHMIVFLLPALLVILRKKQRIVARDFRKILLALPLILVGLLPYGYVLIAARGTAVINWDNAINLQNLIHLFTRADYGTFQSGASYGGLLIQRLYQLRMYADLLLLDFKIPGVLLAAFGLLWLFRKSRDVALYTVIALLFLGPFFFFYASFPLVNRFTLGTYERFLLPSYVLLSILVGLGSIALITVVTGMIKARYTRSQLRILAAGLFMILAIYPITTGSITVWRFIGLSRDRTADLFGEDILASIPRNTGAILLLGRDTPLFITQYVRYGRNVRNDIHVIHGTFLVHPESKEILNKAFPSLTIPPSGGDDFVKDFIAANRDNHPIYSNVKFALDPQWYWINHGLIYRLVREKDLPTPDTLLSDNDALWVIYRNPLDGILSRYKHLMLADILDVYSAARVEFGKILLKAGKISEAGRYFNAAIEYNGDTQLADAYLYKGLTHLFKEDCTAALDAFSSSKEHTLGENPDLLMYEAVTYRDCVGDTSRADDLWKQYQAKKKDTETPLQEW